MSDKIKLSKRESIRLKTLLSLEEARGLIAEFFEHYNTVCLHSAFGYVTPKDNLEARAPLFHSEGERKLEEARALIKKRRGCILNPSRSILPNFIPIVVFSGDFEIHKRLVYL